LIGGGRAIAHAPDRTSPVAPAEVLAPGWAPLTFAAPVPGSYALPPLGAAADGPVVDARGTATRLHALFAGRIAVLSFVYTTCPDVNGCPLATAVLRKLKTALDRDADLAARVVLASLSIDPARDTPARMADYGNGLGSDDGAPWHFLTTAGDADLAPILAGYDQSIARDVGADGTPLGTISHVLRVVLIDRERRIRNVYSASFLHADVVLADVRTLLLEAGGAAARADVGTPRAADRDGVDLLGLAHAPPLGLPPLPAASDNPLTAAKIALGRKLFFDRRLSANDTLSCAMCHVPAQGFTTNEMRTAVGIEGRTVRRNAPTLFNVAYLPRLFHDGRETRLEQQVWGPLLARDEMGNPSADAVIAKLAHLPDYAGLFEAAFDGRGPDAATIGAALASYERTLLAADSPFDRWRFGGDADALGDAARRGFALFTGKAGCAGCHTVGDEHALFTDGELHDTGVGYAAATRPEPATRAIELAPGVVVDVATTSYAAAAEPPPRDLGRFEITQDPADRWKYRTPTLRNVALTAPYMHDGSLATLADVVAYYDRGGVPHDGLDPRLRPRRLDAAERADLVAFLEALTGSTVEALIADARAAPIGDPSGTTFKDKAD
jgi:cytochrome c peroxidase